MKPPNSTPMVQQQPPLQQAPPITAPPIQHQTASNDTNLAQPTTQPAPALIASQASIVMKPQTISVPQEQQAPLALTTQPQAKTNLQTTTTAAPATTPATTTTTRHQINHQVVQIQTTDNQPTQLQTNTTIVTQSGQPIVSLAGAPPNAGTTALVIIPQHSSNSTPQSPAKTTISTKTTAIPTTMAVVTANAHVALSTTTQSSTLQMQAPITTIVPTMTPVPMTAHQHSTTLAQAALVNRPPQTLPVVPITAASLNVKQEPNKYVCCLLDNGIRCERIAGNASFNARIQKIVGTKKLNFALEPTARHAYICDHHKAIITVAKKSTTLARDTKSNARNYTANNNNANTLPTQLTNNFNEIVMGQPTLQHPINLEMLTNQNRLANNPQGVLNNMPVRPGAQMAYGHYQGPHPNQVTPMDVNIGPGSSDATGGDSIPSGSGGIDVDLQQLQVNTLRRYKRHFRVQTRPGLNKLQLAESLKGHFRTLPIIEKEAITYFVYIVKCYRNKLDHNPKAD